MKARISLFFLLGLSLSAWAQFAPPAGEPGSTAVPADSPLFTHWAFHCEVLRGPMDISNPDAGLVTLGEPTFATGPATETEVISLGDGGQAILEFDPPIKDHEGWDFAVFENAFLLTFLELAFVEVSSDGENFLRFPATSLTPTEAQVGPFGELNASLIHNLAGKYEQGYGVPFDLSELPNDPLIDPQQIRFIRLVDVVGSILPAYGTYDHEGRLINDPFPTPFESGGFDLNAVGVLAPNTLGAFTSSRQPLLQFFPNPVSAEVLSIEFSNVLSGNIQIINAMGQAVRNLPLQGQKKVDLPALAIGIYWLIFESKTGELFRLPPLIIVP